MEPIIKHESSSRLRVHLPMKRMTFREADVAIVYIYGCLYSDAMEIQE